MSGRAAKRTERLYKKLDEMMNGPAKVSRRDRARMRKRGGADLISDNPSSERSDRKGEKR